MIQFSLFLFSFNENDDLLVFWKCLRLYKITVHSKGNILMFFDCLSNIVCFLRNLSERFLQFLETCFSKQVYNNMSDRVLEDVIKMNFKGILKIFSFSTKTQCIECM